MAKLALTSTQVLHTILQRSALEASKPKGFMASISSGSLVEAMSLSSACLARSLTPMAAALVGNFSPVLLRAGGSFYVT
jgi:hypothetical protein